MKPVVVRARVADPKETRASLDVDGPSAVLVVCGDGLAVASAEPAHADALARAVAEAVRRNNAIVLDGGTDTRLNALLGAAHASNATAPRALVGMVPARLLERPATHARDDNGAANGAAPSRAGIAELERHHTHLVLAESAQWGDETALLFSLARALADHLPVAALLAGGGEAAIAEALEAVTRGVPLVVVTGSGGSADRLAAAAKTRRREDGDASMRAILASDRVTFAPADDVLVLTRRITWALDGDPVLRHAWRLLATYDRAAVGLRREFERLQSAILAFGLLATLLALMHQEIGTKPLRWAVIVASIVVGGMTAFASRRVTGKRWIVTRAAAESVKSEIFRYRTRTGAYAGHPRDGPSRHRAAALASRLDAIQAQLTHSEASNSALVQYEGPLPPDGHRADDDGLRPLGPERYLELRIGDQLAYYRRRLYTFDRRRTVLVAIAVAAAATGALIATTSAQTWVALTTALGAAPLAYLAHLQVDTAIISYNRCIAQLETLVRRWYAHGPGARSHELFAELVDATESVLAAEHLAWVAQMTEAMRHPDDDQQDEGAVPA